MFKVHNLSKSYSKQPILQNINFEISEGQLIGLLGRNGSGKSTLMRLLAQNDTFTSGDILYFGESLKSTKIKLNPKLAFLTEEQSLPNFKPLESWIKIFKKLYTEYDLNLSKQLFEELDVDTSKNFFELSRGQKMKSLFALQAPKAPRIYILDEITSVLDSGSRILIMQFLSQERKRGASIVISTNIASELQGHATHIGVLSNHSLALYCEVNKIQDHFIKVKSEAGKNFKAAKPVHLNSDGSWSYLVAKDNFISGDLNASLIDRRGITIEDVSSYFSTGSES